MSEENVVAELHRERWRRLRGSMNLLDPRAKCFAEDGLSGVLRDSSVRMLILAGNPEANHIEFDDEFWKWWLSERKDPVTGGDTYWGPHARPTVSAAIRGVSPDSRHFSRLIAVRRDGGLVMGLGSEGVYRSSRQPQEMRAFRLILIVGRIWSALDLYREAILRLSIDGPWEISLAIPNTTGSMLGNLGEGWAEPAEYDDDLLPCDQPGLLLRRELIQFPDAPGVQALAFSFGAWLEDCWSMRQRRFLARRGQFVGQFDKSKYRWS